jgi:nitrate/TMAO reductase-like tetraheme cytochrome c subunit
MAELWKKLWRLLASPHPSLALGLLVGGGIIAGAVGWITFDSVLHATSKDSFCLSCHELEVNIGIDFETRSHAVNQLGVRAACSDCHIPEPMIPKYMRKARAVGEVYHHILGTIDTPEKFEAHRMTMAMRVWKEMESNDSRECRSCHEQSSWVLEDQSERAQEFHASSMSRGKTCISCHKGVAHVLPAGIEEDTPIDSAGVSEGADASEMNQAARQLVHHQELARQQEREQ